MRFLMFLVLNQSVKHLLTDKIYLKHTPYLYLYNPKTNRLK